MKAEACEGTLIKGKIKKGVVESAVKNMCNLSLERGSMCMYVFVFSTKLTCSTHIMQIY